MEREAQDEKYFRYQTTSGFTIEIPDTVLPVYNSVEGTVDWFDFTAASLGLNPFPNLDVPTIDENLPYESVLSTIVLSTTTNNPPRFKARLNATAVKNVEFGMLAT